MAFVLAHKLREAVASETKDAHVGGEGKIAELDGSYIGRCLKPASLPSIVLIVALRKTKTASAKNVVVGSARYDRFR